MGRRRGDYDLIIGTIRGKVYLIPNEGMPESYSFGKEQIEQLEKEHKEALDRMSELRSKLPAEFESHGWVWLFLRKKI